MSDEVFKIAEQINALEEERKKYRAIILDNNKINQDMRDCIERVEDEQHKLTSKIFEYLGIPDYTDTDWL